AGGRSEASGGQPGFSGIHVSLRSRPVRPLASIPKRVPVEEGLDEGTGRAAGDDQQPDVLQADPGPDSGTESESAGLGRLFQYRISQRGLPESQPVRAATFATSSTPPKPTPLS